MDMLKLNYSINGTQFSELIGNFDATHYRIHNLEQMGTDNMKGLEFNNISLILIDGDFRYEVLNGTTKTVIIYFKEVRTASITKNWITQNISNYSLPTAVYIRSMKLLGV